MTQLQFLQGQVKWAEQWLSKLDSEYPGTLTREKVYTVLENAQLELIDFFALQVTPQGYKLVCVEPEGA